jgi:F5/8 type C domain/PKD domain
MAMLLLSVAVFSLNNALFPMIVYGDKVSKDNSDFDSNNNNNNNNKVKNRPLINDISNQVAANSNAGTNREAVKHIIERIQAQISLIAGQDKATNTIKQIRSVLELNPAGPLAQALLSLAKEEAFGNTDLVTQAAVLLAMHVPTGNNEGIAKIIEQAPSSNKQSISSQYPHSSSSTYGQSPNSSVTALSCNSLATSSITAIGSDGINLPTNAIDNNLLTRWSNHGSGSWIQPDLGNKMTLCSVDIAWYRGNLRQNNFVISVSNDTSSTFTKVFTGKSSGTTSSYERYSFPQVSARYVKVTVNGNTENTWASITEIKVNGFQLNRAPVANAGPDQTVNSGVLVTLDGSGSSDPDGDQIKLAWSQTSGPTVILSNPSVLKPTFTSPLGLTADTPLTFNLQVTDQGGLSATDSVQITVKAGVSMDKFGIKKIYPTKSGGEEWFMNMEDPVHDTRTKPPSMTRNSDGSWKVTSTQVRYEIFTSSGYDATKTHQNALDEKQLEANGYMLAPNDWKNVEMTGLVKFVSGDSTDNWSWYARGGRHTGSGYPDGCEGTSLKGDLFYSSGKVRFAKEQWHVHYVFTSANTSAAASVGKFVGFKSIMYNFQQNGKTVVKLEIWVDPNLDNNWQKVYDFVDSGGLGTGGGECGGAPDQIITWGGPIATFRWDSATNVSIKDLSVREIQPPQ